jgi:hypothetical protein
MTDADARVKFTANAVPSLGDAETARVVEEIERFLSPLLATAQCATAGSS